MKEGEAIRPETSSPSMQSIVDPYRYLVGAVRDRALFHIDPGGVVTTWNPGAEEIYGYRAEEVIGRHISCLYTEEVVASGDLDELLRALPENGPCEAEELQVRKGGWVFRGNVTICPLQDRSGGHVGFAVSVGERVRESLIASSIDLAESQGTGHARLEEMERVYRVLENIPDPVVVYGCNLRIRFMNDAMRRMAGIFDVDHGGRGEDEIWPPEVHEASLESLREAFETGTIRPLEVDAPLDGDGIHHLRITWIPLSDADGAIEEVVGIVRDNGTAQAQGSGQGSGLTEERIAASDEPHMHGSAACGPIVVYSLRIEDGEPRLAWVTENVHPLTGFPPGDASTEWWRDRIHPDDRKRILDSLPTPYETDFQVLEYRFLRKDGTDFWVRDERRLLRDADGLPIEVIGSWTDISERVRLEERVRQLRRIELIGRLAGGMPAQVGAGVGA